MLSDYMSPPTGRGMGKGHSRYNPPPNSYSVLPEERLRSVDRSSRDRSSVSLRGNVWLLNDYVTGLVVSLGARLHFLPSPLCDGSWFFPKGRWTL